MTNYILYQKLSKNNMFILSEILKILKKAFIILFGIKGQED